MASVKQCWIRKYGEEEGLKMWKEHASSKLANSLKTFIQRHGEEIGTKKWDDYVLKKKKMGTLTGYIERYGEEEGKKKYDEKNEKVSVKYENYKAKGFSDEEIKIKLDAHKEKSKINLEILIRKYGEEEGKKKYDDMIWKKKITSKWSIEYWLIKFDGDLERAKIHLGDYQRRDVKFFIEMYGEIEGRERWELSCLKKSKNRKNKTFNKSKGQLELEEFVRSNFPTQLVYGYDDNFAIFLNDDEMKILNQKSIYPDIIINKNIIVEYHGDFWHASEKLFPDENEIHRFIKKPVSEIRRIDDVKISILKNRNYKIVVVWESEWTMDIENTKRKLLEILNNEI